MARKVDKWEAETDPPSLHENLESAVTAEMLALIGFKGSEDSQAPAIIRDIVRQSDAAIACLAQLKGSPS